MCLKARHLHELKEAIENIKIKCISIYFYPASSHSSAFGVRERSFQDSPVTLTV